ncbi:MAG TPA: ATP-binding protein [Chloroflexi bacterium]|nr:ATP-binding protein [Chloroflexota bacterium]
MNNLHLVPLVFIVILVGLLVLATLVARRQEIVLRVPARLESVRLLTDLVTDLARRARLGEEAVFHCQLAMDEACTNIIKHAYANDPSGEIEMVLRIGNGECEIQLVDFGEPYDPERVPPPQKASSIEDARPGGLGLYLIRNVMDEVRYIPGPEGNRLVMVKRRTPGK